MPNVQENLYTIVSSDTTLRALLGGSASDTHVYPQIPNSPEQFPCIVYAIASDSSRTVPRNAMDINLQYIIYARDKNTVEQIFTRLDYLVNYYKKVSDPKIRWMRRSLGSDEPETDRDLKAKVVRYQIWAINS